MSQFNGLVSADVYSVVDAIRNFKNQYAKSKDKYLQVKERAKNDTVECKFLFFFKRKKNLLKAALEGSGWWDSIYSCLQPHYPEDISDLDIQVLEAGKDYMSDIEQMYEAMSYREERGIYLTPDQCRKVNRWKNAVEDTYEEN